MKSLTLYRTSHTQHEYSSVNLLHIFRTLFIEHIRWLLLSVMFRFLQKCLTTGKRFPVNFFKLVKEFNRYANQGKNDFRFAITKDEMKKFV